MQIKEKSNKMIIDFNNIPIEKIEKFKGGDGYVLNRQFIDDNNRICYSVLPPNCSSGYHKHITNSEILIMIKGSAKFLCDNYEERANAGQVHYCPQGSSHCMVNDTSEDIEYITIVPEHNK